jgi:hypothetical protein
MPVTGTKVPSLTFVLRMLLFHRGQAAVQPTMIGRARSFGQVKMPSLFALHTSDRAIGDPFVGLPVQRHPDREPARRVVSNDLNAANRASVEQPLGTLFGGRRSLVQLFPPASPCPLYSGRIGFSGKNDRRSGVIATAKVMEAPEGYYSPSWAQFYRHIPGRRC